MKLSLLLLSVFMTLELVQAHEIDPLIPGDCLACKFIMEKIVANLTDPVTERALGDKFIEIVCPFAPQKDVECRTLADQYADDLIEAVTYEYLWPDDFCAAIGLC